MTYAVVIEPSAKGFAVSPVQFPGFATAKCKEEALKLAAQQVALGLLEREPEPLDVDTLDLSDYEAGSEVVYIEPAPVNPISLRLEAEIKQQGLSLGEVARRAGLHRPAVSRLINPFYWSHSVQSLKRIAEVLGKDVEITFVSHAKKPTQGAAL